MKYWENVANFIFIPVSTSLDSLCGSSHPPAKSYPLTTLCSSSKKLLPSSYWSTVWRARAGTSQPYKAKLGSSTGSLWAPHFFLQGTWPCTEQLLPHRTYPGEQCRGRLTLGRPYGVPLITLGLLKANETMLKAVCQRLQSLLAHAFNMLQCCLGGVLLRAVSPTQLLPLL